MGKNGLSIWKKIDTDISYIYIYKKLQILKSGSRALKFLDKNGREYIYDIMRGNNIFQYKKCKFKKVNESD